MLAAVSLETRSIRAPSCLVQSVLDLMPLALLCLWPKLLHGQKQLLVTPVTALCVSSAPFLFSVNFLGLTRPQQQGLQQGPCLHLIEAV